MDEEALPRIIMCITPIGQRKTGRPKARWREEVGKDARMLEERSWWSTAMNREEWRPFKGGQDSYRVVEPMMMMMTIPLRNLLNFSFLSYLEVGWIFWTTIQTLKFIGPANLFSYNSGFRIMFVALVSHQQQFLFNSDNLYILTHVS
jgi:hypothetical protein